ncbi:antitoxin VbhA family protein [Pseudomonas syringae pv. syringae]|uniref:antitoxin VbhA family protein n=1 Tax=Pseudomonas syringae TaxID=317 RepID=UPI00200AD105|nr:antitoxin VbhA family protein [Pseudomonas syringae]MCK9754415.1 antitoxin VbhA family protein [Pseudomonas syringae pv. syringae]
MKRKNISDLSSISNAEKRRRQVAVDYARASISLEGFTLGTDQEGRARAFVDGELTLAEFVSVYDAQISLVR